MRNKSIIFFILITLLIISSYSYAKLSMINSEKCIENYDVSGIHIDDCFYPTDIGTADENRYSEYKKNRQKIRACDLCKL